MCDAEPPWHIVSVPQGCVMGVPQGGPGCVQWLPTMSHTGATQHFGSEGLGEGGVCRRKREVLRCPILNPVLWK